MPFPALPCVWGSVPEPPGELAGATRDCGERMQRLLLGPLRKVNLERHIPGGLRRHPQVPADLADECHERTEIDSRPVRRSWRDVVVRRPADPQVNRQAAARPGP